jgi:hypothetical protein
MFVYLLLYAMPLAARRLNDPPMGAHCLVAAYHHRLVEVWIDEFALVERHLDALPVRLEVLIRAGDAVHGNGLPSFGEALLFFSHPFDPRLGQRRVLLPSLLPLGLRRTGFRRVLVVDVLIEVGLFIFFVDVWGTVVLIADATRRRDGFRRPCFFLCEETRARGAAMEPDVIILVHHMLIRRRHPSVGEGERPTPQGSRDALVHRTVVLRQ